MNAFYSKHTEKTRCPPDFRAKATAGAALFLLHLYVLCDKLMSLQKKEESP